MGKFATEVSEAEPGRSIIACHLGRWSFAEASEAFKQRGAILLDKFLPQLLYVGGPGQRGEAGGPNN